jgi:hypothetical protein
MLVEVQKKQDHMFMNSQKYDDLREELVNLGKECNNLNEFYLKVNLVWRDLVEKYCLKSPIHDYRFRAIIKKKDKEEYIYVYLYSNVDQEKMVEEQEKIKKRLIESETIMNNNLQDESYINDMRVTDKMIELFKAAMIAIKSKYVKNPHYILDNMDEMKKSFYEYMIDVLSNKELCGIQKKVMLENEYTRYMSHMTGIEVILPEELKYV